MMANPWRGEVEIMLDRNSYVLRPSFEALCHIEQKLSTGLMALIRKLIDGTLTLDELVTIIECCMLAHKEPGFVKQALSGRTLAAPVNAVVEMFALAFGECHAYRCE